KSRRRSRSGPARRFRPQPKLAFSRRPRVNRERMHGTCELVGKRRINHAVPLDPALSFESSRHNIDPEVRLAARPVAGMTLMQMRLVLDFKAFGKESFAQLVRDSLARVHVEELNLATAFRQWRSGMGGIRNVKT